MGVGSSKSTSRPRHGSRQRAGALALAALSSCALDFGLGGRQFDCPPEVTNCLACNPDGTCRIEQVDPGLSTLPEPGPSVQLPPMQPEPPDASVPEQPEPPDASVPEQPVPPELPPVIDDPTSDGGPSDPPPPDSGPVDPPPVPDVCPEFQAPAGNRMCLGGDDQCFTLNNVMSPALALWLDPKPLPRNGSGYACVRQ